jgi:hypothetical protein
VDNAGGGSPAFYYDAETVEKVALIMRYFCRNPRFRVKIAHAHVDKTR